MKAMYRRMKEMNVKIVGVGDHGTSLGVYFHDPDGNEAEVFYELPKDEWLDEDGKELKHFPGSLEEEETARAA
jgi:catechol-2,3-dioxygenase